MVTRDVLLVGKNIYMFLTPPTVLAVLEKLYNVIPGNRNF